MPVARIVQIPKRIGKRIQLRVDDITEQPLPPDLHRRVGRAESRQIIVDEKPRSGRFAEWHLEQVIPQDVRRAHVVGRLGFGRIENRQLLRLGRAASLPQRERGQGRDLAAVAVTEQMYLATVIRPQCPAQCGCQPQSVDVGQGFG